MCFNISTKHMVLERVGKGSTDGQLQYDVFMCCGVVAGGGRLLQTHSPDRTWQVCP